MNACAIISGIMSSMSTKIGVLCKTNDDYGTDVELLCGEWYKNLLTSIRSVTICIRVLR